MKMNKKEFKKGDLVACKTIREDFCLGYVQDIKPIEGEHKLYVVAWSDDSEMNYKHEMMLSFRAYLESRMDRVSG